MTHGHTINTVSSYSQGIHWNDNVRKIIFSLCVYTYLFIYYMFVFQPHPGAEQPRVLLCFGMEMLPIEFTLLKITYRLKKNILPAICPAHGCLLLNSIFAITQFFWLRFDAPSTKPHCVSTCGSGHYWVQDLRFTCI